MLKTENYQLNKPEPADPLRVADFNQNADIIDAALGALNTVVANAGNCKVAMGSYVGTDTYGASQKRTLTFDFKPKYLRIIAVTGGFASHFCGVEAMAGQTTVAVYSGYESTVYRSMLNVTWGENSVSWYNTQDVYFALNYSGYTYYYMALG